MEKIDVFQIEKEGYISGAIQNQVLINNKKYQNKKYYRELFEFLENNSANVYIFGNAIDHGDNKKDLVQKLREKYEDSKIIIYTINPEKSGVAKDANTKHHKFKVGSSITLMDKVLDLIDNK